MLGRCEIALTEEGEAAFTETLPWASEVQNNLVRGLDPEDVPKLKTMLKTMFSNIRSEDIDNKVSDEPAAADARVLDL